MMTQRTPLRIVTIIAAVLIALVALPVGYVIRERHKCDQRLVHALCGTDYQALLNACRELSQRVAAGDLKPKPYVLRLNWSWFGLGRRRPPPPEVTGFPKAILDLDPVLVRIDPNGRIWVALHVYPDQGVFAYPENYPNYSGVHFGDVELIPGLWFSDELYRTDGGPEYVRYINELIQKGKDCQRTIREGR